MIEKSLKVLSLFDGIGGGIEALKRTRIPIDTYIAYEIDKNAIKICQKNHPEVIEKGDIRGADFTQYEGFDLVIGGFCCQSFSIAGKQLGFKDERGQLFFEYLRALREVQPKYFLAENVAMKKEFENAISELLGVQPILINSALVSAQNRKRNYWTNIPNVTQPEDKHIMLADIVHYRRY